MTRSWRDEYRKCDACKREYRPQRQAQSYCSPHCKRAAAYGRERFAKGTKGARRRRLEGSATLPGTSIARSIRNGVFSSIKPIPCKGGDTPVLVQDQQWSHLYRIHWPDGVVTGPAN